MFGLLVYGYTNEGGCFYTVEHRSMLQACRQMTALDKDPSDVNVVLGEDVTYMFSVVYNTTKQPLYLTTQYATRFIPREPGDVNLRLVEQVILDVSTHAWHVPYECTLVPDDGGIRVTIQKGRGLLSNVVALVERVLDHFESKTS